MLGQDWPLHSHKSTRACQEQHPMINGTLAFKYSTSILCLISKDTFIIANELYGFPARYLLLNSSCLSEISIKKLLKSALPLVYQNFGWFLLESGAIKGNSRIFGWYHDIRGIFQLFYFCLKWWYETWRYASNNTWEQCRGII